MKRRDFLRQAGFSVGALPALTLPATTAAGSMSNREAFRPDDWSSVRDQFSLTRSRIHMAMFLLASHPAPVAAAIERHRRAFDEDPAGYFHEHFMGMDATVRTAVAEYTGGSPNHIALTDSTTMGLGLVYSGLQLRPDDEILTTTHDHYSTHMSLEHRAERTGAKVRMVDLYANPATVSVDEVCTNLRNAIRPNTRVVAVTWVHSCTGVKLPLKQMSNVVAEINRSRDESDRILICADGVHGFGIDDVQLNELGVDFFMAGTHKWIFGPRGTGIIWGKPEAWSQLAPIIPSFGPNYGVWLGQLPREQVPVGDLMTPGGFHSFEHRWALPEAFRFHLDIGKARVAARIHQLNKMMKEGLRAMRHVTLHTPMDSQLSAGIICFEVDGLTPDEVVEHLAGAGITASTSPYRVVYARVAPSLVNTEEEVERTLAAIRRLA